MVLEEFLVSLCMPLGAVNEIGILMEIAILYIAHSDGANGKFKDYLQSKIAYGLLDYVLPGHTGLSSELSSAIDTINEAIKQAYGSAQIDSI